MTTTISGSNGIDKVATGAVTKDKLPAGTVLQVVSATTASQVSTSSTSLVTSGLTATITPTSATSKIYVVLSTPAITAANNNAYFTIYRNSTNVLGGTATMGSIVNSSTVYGMGAQAALAYLDSPATTSATTYTLYFYSTGGTAICQLNGQAGSITLMEIAA